MIDGTEAERIGLVNRVAPAAELDAATDALVDELLACAPVAVGFAKRVLDGAAKPGAGGDAWSTRSRCRSCARAPRTSPRARGRSPRAASRSSPGADDRSEAHGVADDLRRAAHGARRRAPRARPGAPCCARRSSACALGRQEVVHVADRVHGSARGDRTSPLRCEGLRFSARSSRRGSASPAKAGAVERRAHAAAVPAPCLATLFTATPAMEARRRG